MNKIFYSGYVSVIIESAHTMHDFVVIHWRPNGFFTNQVYTTTTHVTNIILQSSSDTHTVNGMSVDKVGFNLLRDKILKKH